MPTKHADFFAALAAPFDEREVKTRSQAGRTFSYITARTCMNRLDDVVGPEGWHDEYTETREGLKCRISIRTPDGEWIFKEDGGGSAGMSSGDDNEKSAFCLPLNAEALTMNGWREYDRLHVGEVILAYDPAAGICKWTSIRLITVFDEPCEVVRIASKSFEMICTPNHRWVVDRRDKGILIKETRDLDSRDKILNSAPAVGGGHPMTPREAAIMGWLATDGSVSLASRPSAGPPSNQFHAVIYQSKEPYRSQIRELLGDDATEHILAAGERHFPGHAVASLTRERSMFRLRNEFAKPLLAMAGIEEWGDLIALVPRLSVEARAAMFQAMLDGDGQHSNSGQVVFGKKSKPGVMEAFEILATLQGVALGTPRFSSEGDVPLRTLRKLPHVHAKGTTITASRPIPVWCPTTGYGTWVTRWNGTITISGNSDAFKRACVKLGIGRYLYRDGTPEFVRERLGEIENQVPPGSDHEPAPAPARREQRGQWGGDPDRRQEEGPRRPEPARSGGGQHGAPRTGKALFAFLKDQEQQHDVGLIRFVQGWAKLQGFPAKMVDFTTEEVALAYQEACRKLRSVQAGEDIPHEAMAN